MHLVGRASAYERYVFSFFAYAEGDGDLRRISGDYYRTLVDRDASSAPSLVLVSPILAGPVDDYLSSRYIAWEACKAGMSAFFVHQDTILLHPSRDAIELEAWARENVRANRLALDALTRLADVDARRVGSYGVSLGALKNVVLVAVEPRLRANVIGLGGCDLPAMLIESREPLVDAYRRGRARLDGAAPAAVSEELRRWFASEPARFAPSIDPARVYLFLGTIDDKVPYEYGRRLWELLGEPRTYLLPLGHYTTIAVAPWVAGVTMPWLHEHLPHMPPSR
jgi:hypothetical protein